MATPETEYGFVDVDGARLYYEVTGSGRPLVLVHGLLIDRRLWDEQVPVFAARHRVIRYDARGYGASPMEQPGQWPGTDMADLLALLDALQIDRAYLLGLSMGGETVHAFTIAHPERVAALIEVGSGAAGWESTPEFEAQWNPFWAAAANGEHERARELFMRVWVDGAWGQAAPALRERARAIMAGYQFGHFKPAPAPPAAEESGDTGAAEPASAPGDAETPAPEATSAAPAEDESAQLARIHVPALIMVGERDQPGAIHAAEVMAAGIPGARKVIIPGAAHIVPLEQPAAFNAAVLDFLDSLPA